MAIGLESAAHGLNLRRLPLAAVLLVFISFLLGAWNVLILKEALTETEQLYRHELLPLTHIKDADNRLIEIERDLKHAIISKTSGARANAIQSIKRNEALLDEEITQAKTGITRYENIQRLSRFETLYAEYRKNVDHALGILENADSQDDDPADYVLGEGFQKVIRSTDKLLDEIADSKEQAALDRLTSAETLNARSRWLSLVVLGALLAAGAFILFYVKHAYANPIRKLRTSADSLAAGILDIAIPYTELQHPVGDCARSLRQIHTRLKAMQSRLEVHSNIARALPGEIESVVNMIVANAKDGPFVDTALTVERQQEFTAGLKRMLGAGVGKRLTWSGKLELVPGELWVYRLSGGVAAFALVQGLNDKLGLERELSAIAVHSSCRGQGIGAEMLSFFCRQFSGRDLYMQCKPQSAMLQMALHRGFATYGNIGPEILLKRPADFGIDNQIRHQAGASAPSSG